MITVPRILIVDDVLGRCHADGPNEERANICAHFLIRDISGDSAVSSQNVRTPVAEAVFERGQTPALSGVGDNVENSIEIILKRALNGWTNDPRRWSLALIDLSFATGLVTKASDAAVKGMPPLRMDEAPSDYFGLRVLDALRRELPDLPLVVLSSRSRNDVARALAERGAHGFIETDVDDAPEVLAEAINRHGLIPDSRGRIIGRSVALEKMLRSARRVSLGQQNVLIKGESGSGKELVADYLSTHRPRSRGTPPMQVVGPATLSGDLYSSELFGYRRGAFPEARSDKTGAIELANRGDLMLDEVASMTPSVQLALLRVLEENVVVPAGAAAHEARRVQVRFIATTSANLAELVAAGTFREDLLDRLQAGGVIHVPSLRERPTDIPLLVEHFVRMAEQDMVARPRESSDSALEKCMRFDWPRNVRQLKSTVYKAVSAHPHLDYLLPEHIELPTDEALHQSPAARQGVDGLVDVLDQFRFDLLANSDLAGTLNKVESATGRLLIRLLREALRRHQKPDGHIPIQPTLKFLTGANQLPATVAYDIVNRLTKRHHVEQFSQDDPILEVLKRSQTRRRPPRGET